MLLTLVYLLAKLTLLVCFCVCFYGQFLVTFGLTVPLNTCFLHVILFVPFVSACVLK